MRLLACFVALACALPAAAQPRKDAVVMAMALEPPVLDPAANASASIGEITHYNLFEGLTRIEENGEVSPLLAESWTIAPDFKTYTFKLRQGVKFHDGTTFDAADVKFSFLRYGDEKSVNKRKPVFANMEAIETPDPATVVIRLKQPNPTLLFSLGENTAIIQAPETADSNAVRPVGTGPFRLERWNRGDSVTLVRADTWRDPAAVKLNRVTFRFIADPNAIIAALLAGDVDAVPQFGAPEALDLFRRNPNFVVTIGTTEGDTVLAINHRRAPLSDVRVRRAISHALDRQAIIDGALFGVGTPIGSHFPPHNPAYVDLTGQYRHDPARARALLAEAGRATGMELTLRLPPPSYARRSGEVIASQLGQVGIRVKIENVEWPVWLDQVFNKADFDLSIVSHVEPNDLIIYTNPNYYFGYDNAEFRDLIARLNVAADAATRTELLQAAQRKLADDAVNGFLFNLARVTVHRKGLTGLWKNSPIFANDMTRVSWQ